jgi:hypothetical protein
VRTHLAGRRRRARRAHDRRDDLLAEPRVRHAERRRVGDAGHRAQHAVEPRRRQLLAAAVDEVVQPPADEVLAARAARAQVPGPEPPVDERLAIARGIVDVAVDDLRTAHLDLADLVDGVDHAVIADEPNLGADRVTHAAAGAARAIERLHHRVADLGRAVDAHGGHPEGRLELVHLVKVERARRHAHEAQPRRAERRASGHAREELPVHRIGRRHIGHAIVLDGAEERGRIGLGDGPHASAVQHAKHERRPLAQREPGRRAVRRDVAGAERVPRAHVARLREELAVEMRHELRPPGRARG